MLFLDGTCGLVHKKGCLYRLLLTTPCPKVSAIVGVCHPDTEMIGVGNSRLAYNKYIYYLNLHCS